MLSATASSAQIAEPPRASEHDDVDERRQRRTPVRITLEQALDFATRRAPALGPARASQAAAAELERRSGILLVHPPELTVTAGPRFGSEKTGMDASAMLLQPVPLAGVGAARSRLAAARRDASRGELEEARAGAALGAGAAWIEVRVVGELIRARTGGVREAEALDGLAEARLASGAATAGERALARSLLGTARAALLEAEGRQFVASAELAFQIGRPEELFEPAGRLDLDGPAVSEAEVLVRAARHPRLVHLEAEARAIAEGIEQVRAEGGPTLSVGPSITREGNGDVIVLGHVSLPLPLVNPNEFEATDRVRHALVARAELARERMRLRTEALVALHERFHARKVRDALNEDGVGPARVALDEATRRYREGKAELGEVLVARRSLIEVEERHIVASGAARLAELRLLAVMGRLVPGAS